METAPAVVTPVSDGPWLRSSSGADTLDLRVNVGQSEAGYHYRVEIDGWDEQPWSTDAFPHEHRARWAGNARADDFMVPGEDELAERLTILGGDDWCDTADPGRQMRACVAEGRYGFHFIIHQRIGDGPPERVWCGPVPGDDYEVTLQASREALADVNMIDAGMQPELDGGLER